MPKHRGVTQTVTHSARIEAIAAIAANEPPATTGASYLASKQSSSERYKNFQSSEDRYDEIVLTNMIHL